MQEESYHDLWLQLKRPLTILGGFVILLWLIEGIDQLIFRQSLDNFGGHPRSLVGLWGILWAPFLHRGFQHLIANTGPILILGSIIMLSRPLRDFFTVTIIVVVVGGLGTWLIGPADSVHLGASGLIFGYFGFLLLAAYFERSCRSIAIARVGNVFLNTPVKKVITKNGKACALELEDGTVKEYDHLISSMPLSLMVSRLPEVPQNIKKAAQELKFRNTVIVYLNVQAKNLFPDNWLYVHSAYLQMGRLTNFRNWVPQLYGKEESTICALEYWCYDEDEFWNKSDKELIELGKIELRKTGLIGKAEISDGFVYEIHRCYPVYSTGYKERLKPVEDYLSSVPRTLETQDQRRTRPRIPAWHPDCSLLPMSATPQEEEHE